MGAVLPKIVTNDVNISVVCLIVKLENWYGLIHTYNPDAIRISHFIF